MEQKLKRSAFTIPGTEQWTLKSRRGAEYRIMVFKPESAPPAEGYPVIYMLDANSAFGAMAETVRMLGQGPHKVGPAVVVGIGYETDRPLETDRRFYDYTVRAGADELPPRPNGSAWPETGGADRFLDFIEEELKPLIERELPVDRSRQTLFGHSLGGFFVLYTFFTRREAFQTYAAGSPSTWWKNRYLVSHADRLAASAAETPPERAPQTGLFIGVGSLEKPHMIEDARDLYERLSAAGVPGLRLEYRCLEEENHLSVIYPLLGRAVRFALESGKPSKATR
ncbi:alpha/beta hydrolase [Cohnella laeviribosi]|uniref:alpha/beta hydrolase n=1 Tax=Cohnella laeviribosi TaxID=380174 RepID=UPI003D246F53